VKGASSKQHVEERPPGPGSTDQLSDLAIFQSQFHLSGGHVVNSHLDSMAPRRAIERFPFAGLEFANDLAI